MIFVRRHLIYYINKIKSYLTFGKQSDYNNNKKQFGEQMMNANVDLVQSYFTFKFCSRTVIREFYSFFMTKHIL